jgi:uncharacterized glyoxalase superfamily protein PhnB
MKNNRSMPMSTVIPVLVYDDVGAAVAWLCAAFGFRLRWQVGNHRAQLKVGDGCIVVCEGASSVDGHSIMVRVGNVDAHYSTARAFGAEMLSEPTAYPYGERQYTAADLAGRRWTFSETVDDVDPASWGAEIGDLGG